MRYQEGGPVGPARPVGPADAYLAEKRAQAARALPDEMKITHLQDTYPNTAERIVRFIRDTLAALVLLLLIAVALLSVRFLTQVGNAVDDLTPAPVVTGCPFGPGECGG